MDDDVDDVLVLMKLHERELVVAGLRVLAGVHYPLPLAYLAAAHGPSAAAMRRMQEDQQREIASLADRIEAER